MSADEREEIRLENEARTNFMGWLNHGDLTEDDITGFDYDTARVEVTYQRYESGPVFAGYFHLRVPSRPASDDLADHPATLASDRAHDWGEDFAYFSVDDVSSI